MNSEVSNACSLPAKINELYNYTSKLNLYMSLRYDKSPAGIKRIAAEIEHIKYLVASIESEVR